jgi:hypothetical protein
MHGGDELFFGMPEDKRESLAALVDAPSEVGLNPRPASPAASSPLAVPPPHHRISFGDGEHDPHGGVEPPFTQ